MTSDDATVTTDQAFGHWIVLAVEGRRATCRCRCQTIRIIAVAALLDGSAASSCGCAPMTATEQQGQQRREQIAEWRFRNALRAERGR
jgi:hypothetical protein